MFRKRMMILTVIAALGSFDILLGGDRTNTTSTTVQVIERVLHFPLNEGKASRANLLDRFIAKDEVVKIAFSNGAKFLLDDPVEDYNAIVSWLSGDFLAVSKPMKNFGLYQITNLSRTPNISVSLVLESPPSTPSHAIKAVFISNSSTHSSSVEFQDDFTIYVNRDFNSQLAEWAPDQHVLFDVVEEGKVCYGSCMIIEKFKAYNVDTSSFVIGVP